MTISDWKHIVAPFTDETVAGLRAGEGVLISGVLYTARDKAHARLCALIESGSPLPVDIRGQVIYYAGPAPAPPNRCIGSVGPTTSGRMDKFSDVILAAGITGMIGKGLRDENTKGLIRRYGVPYLSAFGGAGAFYAKRITSANIVAFEDLGPEAVYKLTVEDFPAAVVDDIYGGSLYEANQ